jgi:cytochrome P450
MTLVADLELPQFEYLDPELRGERFHETLRELRERSWVARSEFGYFVLDRESAGMFLRSRSAEFPGVMMFELIGVTEGPLYESLARNIITINGDRHARLRKLTHPFFTPAAADRYRPAMRELLTHLFAPLAERRRCEFVSEFATAYPSKVIATVVGAPLEDWDRLQRLSNLLQSQFDAIAVMSRREELEQAAEEFETYVQELVAQRRGDPRDDLASALIAAESEGDRLSEEECVHLLLDTLNGGIDTTQSQLAHGIRLFAAHPDQWRLLADDPALVPRAVDEILRFEPVAPFTTRVLLEDVEHRDILFPAGTVVFASAWNANREAEGDERPAEFDITADRGSAKPLTFGAGPHFCMGANLARAELQEGLAFLAHHMPDLELDGEAVFGNITGLYGMQSLPVRWGAAA